MTPEERERLEAEAQADLDLVGYAGDARTYRQRLALIAEQRARGVGPGAWLTRYLRWCRSRNRRT